MPVRIEKDEPEFNTSETISNNSGNQGSFIDRGTKQFILMTIVSVVVRAIMRWVFRRR